MTPNRQPIETTVGLTRSTNQVENSKLIETLKGEDLFPAIDLANAPLLKTVAQAVATQLGKSQRKTTDYIRYCTAVSAALSHVPEINGTRSIYNTAMTEELKERLGFY